MGGIIRVPCLGMFHEQVVCGLDMHSVTLV
jgi:hypothetical protein